MSTPPANSSTNYITIRPVPWDHPDSVYLRGLQRKEIVSLGGIEPGTPPTAADVPVFLIAYRDGVPIGCGGLRPLSSPPARHSTAAEVKRMFVEPAQRGPCGTIGLNGTTGPSSVAGLILGSLEDEARARGWQALLLETGTFLVKARRFYERCGFVQCDFFGDYREEDNSVCYEKRLDGLSA